MQHHCEGLFSLINVTFNIPIHIVSNTKYETQNSYDKYNKCETQILPMCEGDNVIVRHSGLLPNPNHYRLIY